jgi:hypothetical protein
MFLESWIVLIAFSIYLVYFVFMSFFSEYYKDKLSEGLGKVFNILWMVVMIVVLTVLLMFNTRCAVDGNCKWMSVTIAVLVVLYTLFHMGWGIYHHIRHNKALDQQKDA